MKVLVNALGADMGGAMRHLTNFLPELGAANPDREYVVLVRSSFELPGTVQPNIRLQYYADRNARSGIWRLFHDLWLLPRRLRREAFGAVVSLTNIGPVWSPVPHVFFQRNALFYCPEYLRELPAWTKLKITLRRRLAIASMARADVTVTPSHAMSEMIRIACPGLDHRRLAILYHGFDGRSFDDPLDAAFQAKVHRVPKPRLLYPSHVAAHKGLGVILGALAELKSRGINMGLVVAGDLDDWPAGADKLRDLMQRMQLQDNVVFMGGVSQRQMGALYRSCDVMVNPSLCESFGFSMLEALGHQMPIVAADLPIHRELCGPAALYYPPLDATRAADRIAEMVQLQNLVDFRQAAAVRLSQFDWSWRRYAREFSSLIDSVLGAQRDKLPTG
jgi:glycosyltransferase involved in cell wall biosynthesis